MTIPSSPSAAPLLSPGQCRTGQHAYDVSDDVLNACSSYHKYKAEKESGITPGDASKGGSSDLTSGMKEGTAAVADKASELKDQASAKTSELADKAGAATREAVNSARDTAQEAKDTARATGVLTCMRHSSPQAHCLQATAQIVLLEVHNTQLSAACCQVCESVLHVAVCTSVHKQNRRLFW